MRYTVLCSNHFTCSASLGAPQYAGLLPPRRPKSIRRAAPIWKPFNFCISRAFKFWGNNTTMLMRKPSRVVHNVFYMCSIVTSEAPWRRASIIPLGIELMWKSIFLPQNHGHVFPNGHAAFGPHTDLYNTTKQRKKSLLYNWKYHRIHSTMLGHPTITILVLNDKIMRNFTRSC